MDGKLATVFSDLRFTILRLAVTIPGPHACRAIAMLLDASPSTFCVDRLAANKSLPSCFELVWALPRCDCAIRPHKTCFGRNKVHGTTMYRAVHQIAFHRTAAIFCDARSGGVFVCVHVRCLRRLAVICQFVFALAFLCGHVFVRLWGSICTYTKT
jgi:hypothetical protein